MIQFRLGPALVILGTIAVVPLFWLAGATLVEEWTTADYSHGPAIVLLAVYMFLLALRGVAPNNVDARAIWPGFVVLAGSLFLGLFGTVARIGDIVAYGFILWVAGLTLTITGWQRGRPLMIPVSLLVFMLPLPQFLYWKLTIWLQLVSSEIGVWVIAAAGVPVYLEGNVIDLGVYQLQVAEACSGLRYLIPIMSLSIVIALLYDGPRGHRLVLVLVSGPVTVILNATRIGIVGIMVDAYGIGQAEGFLHVFEGWVIFATCIGLLLLLAKVLFLTIPAETRPARMLLIETDGLGASAARFGDILPTRGLVVAVCAGFFASVLALLSQSTTPNEIARQPFVLFPSEINEWTGSRSTLAPNVARVLAADDYIDITFQSPQVDDPINLFVAWYLDQADGSSIHSPEVCLPVNGWEIFEFDTHQLNLSNTGYGVFDVNRTIIQNGLERQLVYYWFEQRGKRLTNDFAAKAVVIYDGIVKGRTDGALIRYITDIPPGETTDSADARLTAFIQQSISLLPAFVPF
jgi:exosortase D (VPLPA-CTERM-specific)